MPTSTQHTLPGPGDGSGVPSETAGGALGPAGVAAGRRLHRDRELDWFPHRGVDASPMRGPDRVDAACRRALDAEAVNVGLISRILLGGRGPSGRP